MGRGHAFSQKDFSPLGTRESIDVALHRLCQKGTIRRVIRGIYDYPRSSELLDSELSPDIDQVAHALARKFGWRIQPSGASALNLMGISTQVPARYVYLSNGPDREYSIRRTKLQFEHITLKEANFAVRESSLIVQGLKSLGPEGITPLVVRQIRDWLDESKYQRVLKDTKTTRGWIYSAIREICLEPSHG